MSLRILLIDDANDLRNSITQALVGLGYEVVAARGGAEGLCVLRDQPPFDVVLLDLLMPDIHGDKVLQEMLTSGPPIILMTGAPEAVPVPLPGVVRHVLLKAFTLSDLVDMIEDVTGEKPGDRPCDPLAGGGP